MRLCIIIIALFTWCNLGWANNEYALYQEQGSRCGETNDYIVKEALENYDQWKKARDNGYQAPPNTFRTAGQQFEYLQKNGCRDGLILYRFGNILRHNHKYDRAISILLTSIDDLKVNYPSYVSWAYYSLGMCSTSIKQFDNAIKYYRQAINHDPNDIDSHINLAHRLYYKEDFTEALEQCNYILKNFSGSISSYGKNICKDIIRKIESK